MCIESILEQNLAALLVQLCEWTAALIDPHPTYLQVTLSSVLRQR